MRKVIIFGTGKLSKVLEDALNEKVNVIAYADNDKSKWNKFHNGKLIINPSQISEYDFDYILIGSQYNEEIYNQLLNLKFTDSRIFEFIKFLDYNWDHVEAMIKLALQKENETETLVTGISYANVGFSVEAYENSCNLANVSQDLFYDFSLIEFLLSNNKFDKVRDVIIGLSYYSFQYDLSYSAMKSKGVLYYKNLNVKHHEVGIEKAAKNMEKNNGIAKKIFDFDKNNTVNFNWEISDNYIINEEMGKWQAELDCNKNYPKTVNENTNILKEYLEFLKNRNISATIVVFPATKYYTKYFSKEIEEEFHKIIYEANQEYEFKYLDYFRSELFDDDDFKDVSHLNSKGAMKFTEILYKSIHR